MLDPPITRREFEEKNRRVLAGARDLPESELFAWQRGRDWLVERTQPAPEADPHRRRSPRLPLQLSAHIAGIGSATTADIGFHGLGLLPARGGPLQQGEEASVRVTLVGRSIYAIGRVVWTDATRVGLALEAIHPSDARALQAAVCNGLLNHWEPR